MSYEEYVNRIKEIFMECGHTKEKTEAYFNTQEVKEILEDNFAYVDDEMMSASVTPEAVASTLDLLY